MQRWRIQIDASGPTWASALAGVAKLLAEGVASGPLLGTVGDERDGCRYTMTCLNLRPSDEEPKGGARLVRPAR